MPDVAWTFDDPDDAARYRREVAMLWGAWIGAMVVLILAQGWVLWVAGATILVVLMMLSRPLQSRAATIVPEDETPKPGLSGIHRSRKDRVLRELAYGEAPLRASGGGPAWVWGRRLVVAVTFAGVAFVLYDLVTTGG
jgi:hypothetical protein